MDIYLYSDLCVVGRTKIEENCENLRGQSMSQTMSKDWNVIRKHLVNRNFDSYSEAAQPFGL
jgi:hypothetical protein